MKTIIIYDTSGNIISIYGGNPEPSTPTGIPYLIVEHDELSNKKVLGVDTSITPHVLITEPFLVKPTYEDLENKVLLLESEKVEGGIF